MLADYVNMYTANYPSRPSALRSRRSSDVVVLVTGTTGNFGSSLLETLLKNDTIASVYALNRRGSSNALDRQRAAFIAQKLDVDLLMSPRLTLLECDLAMRGLGLETYVLDEVSCVR